MFTPRFRDGKGTGREKGRPTALASLHFTTRLRNGEGSRERDGKGRGSGQFLGRGSLPLPAVPVSPQLFFSGDGRDVSGDGRRESEGKRESEFQAALVIRSFFPPLHVFSAFFLGRKGRRERGGQRV